MIRWNQSPNFSPSLANKPKHRTSRPNPVHRPVNPPERKNKRKKSHRPRSRKHRSSRYTPSRRLLYRPSTTPATSHRELTSAESRITNVTRGIAVTRAHARGCSYWCMYVVYIMACEPALASAGRKNPSSSGLREYSPRRGSDLSPASWRSSGRTKVDEVRLAWLASS